jgi:hypothetical protein
MRYLFLLGLLFCACKGNHIPNWEAPLVKNYLTSMGEPNAPFSCIEDIGILSNDDEDAVCSIKINGSLYNLYCSKYTLKCSLLDNQ